jgi:glycosyltransferase involved in cell wall biosynthesis
MDVIYLTQVFEVGHDPGSERHFYFCKYLVRHGHMATAITSNVDYKRATVKYPGEGWHVRRQIESVDIRYVCSYANIRGSFKKRLWYYLTYLFTATLAGLFVRKPDVIYAVSTPLTVGFLGYCLSRLRGVPFVFEVTDVWPDAAVAVGVVQNQALIRAARWLELFCYRKAARIVALSEGIRENIIHKGVLPGKVALITNGVDSSLFRLAPTADTDRARLRQELGFEGHFVCMYLGAHGAYNALGTIIDAAEALRDDPRYLCVLVGDGDDKPRLQAMVQGRGQDNVRFLLPVPRAEAPGLLRAADVFLLPNRRGEFYTMNLPNKLFDFLASGRPIIVAGHGESGDLVQRAEAGYVVPAEDGAAMAEAIIELAALSDAERAAMGESGRRYVLEHYNRDKLSQTFLGLLEHVVQSA